MEAGKRIVYFGDGNAESQQDSIGYYFQKAFMDSFESLGYNIRYVDIGQGEREASGVFNEVLEKGFLFGLGFGGTTLQKVLELRSETGELLYNRSCMPYVAILVDPLFNPYNSALFQNKLDYLLLCMADETELKNGISFCPGVRQTFMTTGFSFVCDSAKLQPKPMEERSFGIVYFGNYYSCFHRQWPDIPQAAALILNDVIDLLMDEPLIPYAEAVRKVLSSHGMAVSEDWFRLFCEKYLMIPMLYLRGWSRREAVRILANSGFRVDVWGTDIALQGFPLTGSWGDEKNIVLHPPVSFRDMLSIMSDARMTLSVMAYPGGISERLGSGMLSGSVVLTDRSTYYDRNFVSGEDSLAFTWGKLEEYPSQVLDLFRDADRMQHMADVGRKKILDAHLPIHLAKRIEQQVAIYKDQHGLF